MLSQDHVEAAYRRAYQECRMEGRRLPPPHAIQELVQAWKLLWKRQR